MTLSMDEGEASWGPSRTSRTKQSAPPKQDALPATNDAPVFDLAGALARLAGRPASEVLARISNGNPLNLYAQVAQRIRETYFVLDPDRVYEKALLVVAVGIEVEARAFTRPEWLLGRIDRAIRLVLDKDSDEERSGVPPENPEEHFALFVEAFFIDPSLARLSSIRLNGLEERIRKGFFHLIVEGRPLEEVLEMGLAPIERLQHDILTALEAIGLIDEEGFDELFGQEQEP